MVATEAAEQSLGNDTHNFGCIDCCTDQDMKVADNSCNSSNEIDADNKDSAHMCVLFVVKTKNSNQVLVLISAIQSQD